MSTWAIAGRAQNKQTAKLVAEATSIFVDKQFNGFSVIILQSNHLATLMLGPMVEVINTFLI